MQTGADRHHAVAVILGQAMRFTFRGRLTDYSPLDRTARVAMNGCSGRRQLLPLAVVAVVVTVLAAMNVLPPWPGLPHLVALPPVDLFADLRVLLTQATSGSAFVLLLALVLTVRVWRWS